MDLHGSGDMHGSGVGVVTALGLAHVIVGVDGSLAAQLSTQQLDGSVGDHLVGVHVGLRAGACLPDDEGKVIVVEFSRDDLISRLADGVGDHRIQAVVLVHLSRGFLQNSECCQRNK